MDEGFEKLTHQESGHASPCACEDQGLRTGGEVIGECVPADRPVSKALVRHKEGLSSLLPFLLSGIVQKKTI